MSRNVREAEGEQRAERAREEKQRIGSGEREGTERAERARERAERDQSST